MLTLDEIVKIGKELNDDDLMLLLRELDRESCDRDYRRQAESWNEVCEAINNYVKNYGYFTIARDGDATEYFKGDYAFGEPGEINLN